MYVCMYVCVYALHIASHTASSHSVAVLSSLFPSKEVGELALPVVVYHTVQMIVSSIVVPILRCRMSNSGRGLACKSSRGVLDVDNRALVSDDSCAVAVGELPPDEPINLRLFLT